MSDVDFMLIVDFQRSTQMEHDSSAITQIESLCRRFDLRSTLSHLAVLQLLPENAAHVFRLAAHAAIAIQSESSSRANISRSALQKLITKLTPTAWQMMEDPPESLFTQAVTGPDGTYTAITGPCHEAINEAQILYRCLFNAAPEADDFLNDAQRILVLLGRISDWLCDVAGLPRNVALGDADRPGLSLPPREVITNLTSAVTISEKRLESICRSVGLEKNLASMLVIEAGEKDVVDESGLNNALASRPFVHVGGVYIVACPSALMSAAVKSVVKLAVELDHRDNLATRVHRASLGMLGNCLLVWDWEKVSEERDCVGIGQSLLTSRRYQYDVDSFARVVFVSDALHGKGDWLPTIDLEALGNLEGEPTLDPVDLTVVVFQTMGRATALRWNKPVQPSETIILSLADLDLIQWDEPNNPLVLQQFAIHSRKARERFSILTFGTLNEYALYKAHGSSYYLNDEKAPIALSIDPGMATELRTRVLRRRDLHGVRNVERSHVVEAVSIHNTADTPIYISMGERGVLLEAYALPIWITFDNNEWRNEPGLDQTRQVYLVLSEAIAFWLWKAQPLLDRVVSPFISRFPSLTVVIRLVDSESWRAALTSADKPVLSDEMIDVSVDANAGTIALGIHGECWASFETADNHAERRITARLLAGFEALLPPNVKDYLRGDVVDRIIDRVIPLGKRKMVLTVDVTKNHELRPTDTPYVRTVQPAESESILDEIGDRLVNDLQYPVGELSREEGMRVLNEHVVGYLYSRLCAEAETLRSDGLLEWVLGHHESVLLNKARTEFHSVPRMECYGGKMINDIREELKNFSNADLAGRFLVEFLAAQPPHGVEPISLSVYDRLLAICYEIVDSGMLSDMIHYDLADVRHAILESGRLGSSRSELDAKQQDFYSKVFNRQVQDAERVFPRYWRANGHREDLDEYLLEADHAVREEFGIALTDMREGYGLLAATAYDSGEAVTVKPRVWALRHLQDELCWDKEKADQFLDLLTLKPRGDFLKPASPFKGHDVMPWRFNRRLSYLRKPLLLRDTGNEEQLLWTPRNLFRSGTYFLNMLLDARLPANGTHQTAAMSSFMGKSNGARGKQLEKNVAKLFANDARFVARPSVNKIGGESVAKVGDFDAVVCDLARKVIFVCECKNLYMAKTPFEMRQQFDSVSHADPDKKTAERQALRKAQWIRKRKQNVLHDFGVASSDFEQWEVRPLVIVENRMFAAALRPTSVPIVAFDDVHNHVVQTRYPE